jgi:hypothetical protein
MTLRKHAGKSVLKKKYIRMMDGSDCLPRSYTPLLIWNSSELQRNNVNMTMAND